MWRLLLLCCVWGVWGVRGEDSVVGALRGAGRARGALCLPTGGCACAGALWARRWMLARASCLARCAPLGPARLLLHAGVSGCQHLKTEPGAVGDVMARFVHPRFVQWHADDEEPESPHEGLYDAALVLLARPAAVPPALNHTRAYAAVPWLETWLRHVVAQFPATWDRPPPATPRLRLASTPTRLLLLTVLLPTAALLLLFLLLLRYTGGPEDFIPYDTLPHDLTETEEEEPPPPPKPLEV